MRPTIRRATAHDGAFLAEMLGEAIAWRPGSPKPEPSTFTASHYIAGWPQPGDGGVVAEILEPVGAAWYRMLALDDPGHGFVDERTPEVSVGVRAPWRGKGVGRLLLTALFDVAGDDGYTSLSLSVEEDSFALGLYEAVGFQRVRLVGNAWTMALSLAERSRS